MIKELLEKQEVLGEIAAELYGDLWIMNEKFWGSPTERELREVAFKLIDLGYTAEPTPEQEEAAKEIAKKLGFELPPED
jgi:hypothetical protein